MNKTSRKRILMVDDDTDFLAQQKLRFEQAGYEVSVAEDPVKAKAVCAQSRPDLVVVDLMMGDMDAGIVLAHEFKRARPELPIILVTGVTRETGLVFDAETADERRWLWVDKVLAKPVRFSQLQAEAERLLSRAGAAGEPI